MKLIVSLLLLNITLFSSCKKNKGEADSGYLGTWEFRGYSGTPAAVVDPSEAAPGNGSIMKFTADTIYKFLQGQFLSQYDYRIAKDTCIKCYSSPVVLDRLYYKDEAEVTLNRWYVFLEIKNDTLHLYDYNLTAPFNSVRKYVKVAN